jgi:DNA-binding transcriptional ArsR family regulator
MRILARNIVTWQYDDMTSRLEDGLRALGNGKRLLILQYLKDPKAHFPAQVAGDLVADGVCALFITEQLQVSQPTASEHLRILADAGFITGKRIKQWIFYRRDEKAIARFKTKLRSV